MKFYAPAFPHAVTFYCDKIPPQLICKVDVFSKGYSNPVTVNALWDTGAMRSSVSIELAEKMNMPRLGTHLVNTAGGEKEVYLHEVGIRFFNQFSVGNVIVDSVVLDVEKFDVLIGMDIIGQGDLSVGIKDDKYVVSFRYPSQGVEDFVKTIMKENIFGQGHKKKKK